MKRNLLIYFLCSLVCVLSFNFCEAQQSGYGQEVEYGGADRQPPPDGLIPEIDQPVELWLFVGDYRFITGKMVHLTLQMIWRLGVNVDIERFKSVDIAPFNIEKVTIGERQIFNNDCDFRVITYILSMPDDAEEGVYTIPPFTVPYRDEANKTDGHAATSPISLKKVPIMLDTEVDRDVVDLGDRINYKVTMWHERYVKILEKNMEKLDFSPFHVIDFNIEEELEGRLKKTTANFGLSVYDLPEKNENFEIPSQPVLYYRENGEEIKHGDGEELIKTQELGTPAIPVLFKSLLKRIDVPLESIKGPVVHVREDVCMRGHLPIILGALIIVFLGANEIRKFAGRLTKIVKEKISSAPLARAEELEDIVTDFKPDSETDELKKSVINVDCALRTFLGSLVEIPREEVLSYTSTKIISTLKDKNMADIIVGPAGNLLRMFDTAIFGDIDKSEVEKSINEIREILKETKKRGYY